MLALYFIVSGTYLYYSKSKYFPASLYRFTAAWSSWLAALLIALATGLLIRTEGWVSGCLIGLCALSLALMLVPLTAVLGKTYFYSLIGLMHGLVLLDLFF
ncbi:hypothetical protein BWI96_09955 [Siphonobacter sp. SORGH_AS_0500]|uniref:hypothetical protein n=1 Tax=Siphonobacter sp. SORGH_AS_0500 TaxID=1864824 RepID=UPI000CC3B6D3|nr:hypothetical protein [Siphonobacter sp. SORGH_AS_0500]PKK36695.1 hypothetical protein BWI96_09955 [Siphonobacter sp. SORGH_AS_0500]